MCDLSLAPPIVLASARVIAYAIVSDEVVFTGNGPVYVGEELLGRVPRLAIGQPLSGTSGLLLFYRDEAWNVLAAGGGATIEETKRRAETRYAGVAALWIDVDIPREVTLEFHDQSIQGLR